MNRHCKRLIEVDLPIRRISEHARKEKSIGHISSLHTWWARRPLAACRAVICAALWPDPADELCSDAFSHVAQAQMLKWANDQLHLVSMESYRHFLAIKKNPSLLENRKELRVALMNFIADFSDWNNARRNEFEVTAQALTSSAHLSLHENHKTRPLVLDPFAGGGQFPSKHSG